MRYAGFWVRLGAVLVDTIIFIPFMFLYYYLRSISWNTALVVLIPFMLLWPAYNIYFLGRWGQTVGKMIVRIQVVSLDSGAINYRTAFLRHIVDFALSVIGICSMVLALLSVSKAAFETASWNDANKLLYDARPSWGCWVDHCSTLWVISELIVLLFNEKKRAIHDFIAGTVVIEKIDRTV